MKLKRGPSPTTVTECSGPNAARNHGVRESAGDWIALLDDVSTTGPTLQVLAEALLDAGAASVDGWCVARADRRVMAAENPPVAKPA